MKLIAEFDNQRHEVQIKQNGSRLSAEIDGRTYELETSEPEPNVYLFKHDNQIYQIYAAPHGVVNVGNHQLEINVLDPKRLRGSISANAQTDGASEIKTAMPGKVVRVLTETGAEVKKGDGIIVVEAMKMQNEMKSPKDGIIKEIRFSEGATVNAGDVLIVIE